MTVTSVVRHQLELFEKKKKKKKKKTNKVLEGRPFILSLRVKKTEIRKDT